MIRDHLFTIHVQKYYFQQELGYVEIGFDNLFFKNQFLSFILWIFRVDF